MVLSELALLQKEKISVSISIVAHIILLISALEGIRIENASLSAKTQNMQSVPKSRTLMKQKEGILSPAQIATGGGMLLTTGVLTAAINVTLRLEQKKRMLAEGTANGTLLPNIVVFIGGWIVFAGSFLITTGAFIDLSQDYEVEIID